MDKNLKKVIEYLSRQSPIMAAYLFGSMAKGNATEKSDMDLGLLLKDNFNLIAHFDYKLKLIGDLRDVTGREVDIIFIGKADPILQYQIRKHGKLIFERDKKIRIAYEVLARKNYFDFLVIHKRYIEAMVSRA